MTSENFGDLLIQGLEEAVEYERAPWWKQLYWRLRYPRWWRAHERINRRYASVFRALRQEDD